MDMAKPKIRFKGYQEDWEQRKLGDWGTFYYGRSCPKWSVTEDATIPCIRYGELYTKFGAKIDKVYSYTNMSPESLRFSKGTEVLIPRVGEDPMDYNHCTWLSMPDVAIGEMISVFNTENNPLFTATMFNATLQNEFAMRVEGGSVTNLYFEKLKNIDVLFPSLEEQEKIATYFDSLDHLITLHQRKCDQTKKLKKFMLQKMFPQNGKKVPELRFSEFTDDWEQRKLGEFGKTTGGTSIESEFNELGKYKVISIGSYSETSKYNDQGIRANKTNKTESRILNKNNLTMILNDKTASGNIIGRVLLIDADDSYVFNQRTERIEVYENEYLPEFLYHFLNADNIREKIIRAAQGNTQIYVNWNSISELSYKIPLSKHEQRKIADLFNQLDNLITLHQRKYEELQKVKKFMLQNMFV